MFLHNFRLNNFEDSIFVLQYFKTRGTHPLKGIRGGGRPAPPPLKNASFFFLNKGRGYFMNEKDVFISI